MILNTVDLPSAGSVGLGAIIAPCTLPPALYKVGTVDTPTLTTNSVALLT